MRELLAQDLSALDDGDLLYTEDGTPLQVELVWERDCGDVINLSGPSGLFATIVVDDHKDPDAIVHASVSLDENFRVFVAS